MAHAARITRDCMQTLGGWFGDAVDENGCLDMHTKDERKKDWRSQFDNGVGGGWWLKLLAKSPRRPKDPSAKRKTDNASSALYAP